MGSQILCSCLIVFYSPGIAVLRTVQFHHQFCLMAVKICNIVPDHILPTEAERITAQKLIPQMCFFFCHLLSELLRIGFQFLVSFHFAVPHPTSLRSATFPPGEGLRLRRISRPSFPSAYSTFYISCRCHRGRDHWGPPWWQHCGQAAFSRLPWLRQRCRFPWPPFPA